MKKLMFLVVCITVLVVLYRDSNNTVYDTWYKKNVKEVSIFGDEIHTLEMKSSSKSPEDYFVLYDDLKHGIFCNLMEKKKNLYICTPMELNKNNVSSDDYLEEVIDVLRSKDGFFANISYTNFLIYKKLNIKIASLGADCINDNGCDFKKLDSYLSFKYEFIKRLYVSHLSDIS